MRVTTCGAEGPMVHCQSGIAKNIVLESFTHAEARNPVKKIAIAVLLLLSAQIWAGEAPIPAEYTINVHVSSSSVVVERGCQLLEVVIDGKKCELASELSLSRLLALGDYKAKLVKDEHKTTYDSYQVYEFLFPDKKTRQFLLVGQTE